MKFDGTISQQVIEVWKCQNLATAVIARSPKARSTKVMLFLQVPQILRQISSPLKNFLERSCGCHYGKNQGPCSSSFDFEQLFEHLIQCTELSSTELDLVMQRALASHLNLPSGKKRCRMNNFFRGQQVCKNTFMFVFCIDETRLKNIKSHLKQLITLKTR